MKKFLAALSVALVLIFAVGCSQETSPYFYAMNAEASLYINAEAVSGRQGDYNKLLKEVGEVLDGLENSLSATVKNSSVSKFNDAAAGETVEIDENAYNVLNIAKDMYAFTDGAYNPAVYYSVIAYGFNSDGDFPESAEDLPAEEEVAAYVEISRRFGEIGLYESEGKFYAEKPDFTVDYGGQTLSLKIDLGGIGKGYAVDMVDDLFDKYGFAYGYFDFGASSFLCKKSYVNEGGLYSVSLIDPRAKFTHYGVIRAADVCLSTSGDYEKFYTLDGVRYCHVIDPVTGSPVQTGIMTATVIGGSAAEDDALTTAIMAMGRERAAEFIVEKLSGRKVVFTFDNSGAYEVVTNIPENEFTYISSDYTYVAAAEAGGYVA